MELKYEWKPLAYIIAIFALFYIIPFESDTIVTAIKNALQLAHWYAQEHVILCLIPAFFIAGAISVFIQQEAVLKILGDKARKVLSYGVASVSGSILAVCSCTVLPLFAGIYKKGAGIGPATAFLYSGPAINVLAIILTARILGSELGIARAVAAVLFSILIGLSMAFIYRHEKPPTANLLTTSDKKELKPYQSGIFFLVLVLILIFATWSESAQSSFWHAIYSVKWMLTLIATGILLILLWKWFQVKAIKLLGLAIFIALIAALFPTYPVLNFAAAIAMLSLILYTEKGRSEEWLDSSWGLAKQIAPLLFIGVLVAGFLLGKNGTGGIIPSQWVSSLVGGNSILANFFASIIGAFMYFATLTEVPILQGLIASGMGKGPALALLLAGPALSLPSMLVIKSIMGTKKTIVYVSLVVVFSTIAGIIFGNI